MNRKITELDCYIALAADEYSQYKELSDKDSELVIDAAAFISKRIHRHLSGDQPFTEERIEQFHKLNEIAETILAMLKIGK